MVYSLSSPSSQVGPALSYVKTVVAQWHDVCCLAAVSANGISGALTPELFFFALKISPGMWTERTETCLWHQNVCYSHATNVQWDPEGKVPDVSDQIKWDLLNKCSIIVMDQSNDLHRFCSLFRFCVVIEKVLCNTKQQICLTSPGVRKLKIREEQSKHLRSLHKVSG